VADPAYATSEINIVECNIVKGGDYFAIYDDRPGPKIWRCFANAGELDVNSTNVGGFHSGNNAGWFEYEPGDGSRYRHTFGKFESIEKIYGFLAKLHIN
jgi:hypothetical protein